MSPFFLLPRFTERFSVSSVGVVGGRSLTMSIRNNTARDMVDTARRFAGLTVFTGSYREICACSSDVSCSWSARKLIAFETEISLSRYPDTTADRGLLPCRGFHSYYPRNACRPRDQSQEIRREREQIVTIENEQKCASR